MRPLSLRDIHELMHLSAQDARRFGLERTADKLGEVRAELARFFDCAPSEKKAVAAKVIDKLKEVETIRARETDVQPADVPPVSPALTAVGIWGGVIYMAHEFTSDMEQLKRGVMALAGLALASGLAAVGYMMVHSAVERFSLSQALLKMKIITDTCKEKMELEKIDHNCI